MKFAAVACLLAFAAIAAAQSSGDDVTALSGLQSCVQANRASAPYVNGWGGGLTTGQASPPVTSAGRKMLQTAENCAAAAAISSAIPCTPTATTPTTPSGATGSPAGVSTTPSGVPTGTSSNPCGDSSNPVPWTGLLCTNGRVTSVVISQLGPNFFAKSGCDVGTLGGLAGLSAATIVDFTASGLSGTVPTAWSNGSWASTLTQLTLAQNPGINGSVPDISGLTALKSLDISNSSFSGPIPATFNASQALTSFTAFGNKLTGSLPASLPASLTTLGLGKNQLTGSLPAYQSSSLSYLQVNNNNLTGCLPGAWTTGLKNITNIDLSYNQLSGPIPSTWQASGAFPTLQTINIVGNQLCGDVGQLGTPVGTVGQNNPSATRLVPSPGTLAACSGDGCSAASPLSSQSASFAVVGRDYYGPAPSPGPALAPDTAMAALPVLPQL